MHTSKLWWCLYSESILNYLPSDSMNVNGCTRMFHQDIRKGLALQKKKFFVVN